MSARQGVLSSALRGFGYKHRQAVFSDGTDGVLLRVPGGYMEISARDHSWHLFSAPSPTRPMFMQVDTLNEVITEVLIRVGCSDVGSDWPDDERPYVR